MVDLWYLDNDVRVRVLCIGMLFLKKSQRNITDLFDYDVTGRDYKEMNCPMERSDFIRRYCITAIN